ncbi:MAG: Zn-dependent exopeptidase M28, partial [Thermoleophilaceae bacterium]|nr:Zn-dependent exopeptidase M28 [Thermoleophilaceae bacterium]
LEDLAGGGEDPERTRPAAASRAPQAFDAERAFDTLRMQVRLGPRPAGSAASRRLAERIRAVLPDGRIQQVPGGLRNVIGEVPGRDPSRKVVVGAHYDTKDEPGFVGANDAASGTAVALELARSLKPRTVGPTVVFAFFDGEESPRGTPDAQFKQAGLRGSRVAAPTLRGAEAMVLLDFVGDEDLVIPREQGSDPALWAKLRAAAQRAGKQRHFPDAVGGGIVDDHVPFQEQGIPSIDLIDFQFACFHKRCDRISAVSEASLDATGETVRELLRRL